MRWLMTKCTRTGENRPLLFEYNLKWATLKPIIPYVRKRVGEEAAQ